MDERAAAPVTVSAGAPPLCTPLSFQNKQTDYPLAATLYGSVGRVTAIACHGLLSSQQRPEGAELLRVLRPRRIPLLSLDFGGCGRSGGDFYGTTFSRQMSDLDASLAYLAQRGAQRFVLFGMGLGGSVACLAAARDERVVGVATLSACGRPADLPGRPGSDYAGLGPSGDFTTARGALGPTFYADCMAHDVVAAIGIVRAALLVVHGDADASVPSAEAHDLASAARHASLELVLGADHLFSQATHRRAAMRRVGEFIETTALSALF
jgi:pimeloyl-ACP methyl ester carboxylesterase